MDGRELMKNYLKILCIIFAFVFLSGIGPVGLSTIGTGLNLVTDGVFEAVSEGSNIFTANQGFETGGTGGDFNSLAELDDGTSDDFTDWTEQGVNDVNGDKAEATATVHGGSVAAKLTKATVNVLLNSPVGGITVAPGKAYVISMWTRGDGSIAGYYSVYDRSNGALILVAATTGISGAVYTEKKVYFTAPVGCTAIDLNFSVRDVGTVYFDDISVKPVTFTSWTDTADGLAPGTDGAGALTNKASWDGSQSGTSTLTQSGILWPGATNTFVYTTTLR